MTERMPFYRDNAMTLYHGDAATVLADLAPGSADCIVTSPPYYGLRDYGEDGQIGAEASPAEYVESLRAVLAEARRVLADDGTLWLNLGDSYVGGGGYAPNAPSNRAGSKASTSRGLIPGGINPVRGGVGSKNMLGIPWRVAFALQDDGWTLRNDIIWAKPNAMPESVRDRLSNRHEHLFLLTKGARYRFDLDPIREPHRYRYGPRRRSAEEAGNRTGLAPHNGTTQAHPSGRNPGDVWTVATTPFPGAHFATMPPKLAERCVLAGCRPGGTVLDPFSGAGTSGHAANKHGRRYIGIDLSADYLDLSLRTRLPGLDLAPPDTRQGA